jgi:hypothetical protein
VIARWVCIAATIGAVSTGCSGGRIVNTDEAPATAPATASAPPSSPPASNAHLANAFHYVAHPHGSAAYYFVTPSGRWACAIVPRVQAGCQSATNWQSGMAVDGAPDIVSDSGEATAPNAIVVEREGDARFVALTEPKFILDPGPANQLEFNRILAAAGFRCNVQEAAGVSCMSETSGKGFTFSPDGFVPRYTDVPPDAP